MSRNELEKKLEKTGFAYLDLETRELEAVSGALDQIKGIPEYCRAFNYLLSVTKRLDECGLSKDYAFIGGYAVFCHIFSILGPNSIRRWRGSADLDLLAKRKDVSSVLGTHFEEAENIHSHFENKSSLLVRDILELTKENIPEEPLKIDFYSAINGRDMRLDGQTLNGSLWDRTEVVDVLGFKIRVLGLYDLLKLKLNIKTDINNLPRPRDITDIYNLLGIADRKGLKVKSLFETLNGAQRETLFNLLNIYTTYEASEEVLIKPETSFTSEFREIFQEELEKAEKESIITQEAL